MSKKKKTYDQKIEEYTEKLKEFIEKKGRQLWTKLKTPFMEKEKAIEILLVDKDKFNVIFEGIKKILDSLIFEVTPTDATNINEIKDKKEEKNDTGQ